MKKRLLKVAIATALTVAFAVPAFANPFSDVPAKHWAYDAVNKLAQAGIVDGYGDGTFRGDKTLTRYEMAQIVAKAMNKNMNSEQKAMIDKLAREYAAELNNLGVKVAGMQDQMDNMVKFSGDARARYYEAKTQTGSVGDRVEYRFRLGATAKINDDMGIYARITSNSNAIDEGIPASTAAAKNSASGNVAPAVENAYVATNFLGMSTKIGRQDYNLGRGMLASPASVAIMNGVTMRDGDTMVFAGKELDSDNSYAKNYGGQFSFRLGAPITVDYLRLGTKNYYAASTNFELFSGINLFGEYGRNQTQKARAYRVGLGFGSTGLSVAYNDVEANAVPFESMYNLKAKGPSELNDFYALSSGTAGSPAAHVKGMEYQYNKDIAKNVNLDILYQDIKDHGKNLRATASVKF
ncbi:MAG: S-layer homology domain-containing protein [Negativicutes bacterium]|nr:S-layer homology domain-containing protein [Negativicutes bacterium]